MVETSKTEDANMVIQQDGHEWIRFELDADFFVAINEGGVIIGRTDNTGKYDPHTHLSFRNWREISAHVDGFDQ